MHLRVRSRSRLHADRDLDLAFVPIAIAAPRCVISSSPPPCDLAPRWTQSPLSLPSSLNLTGFDDFFFLGFVCVFVLRNEWYYIFVWQPRKCEQQVENVFFMEFSRTQPNIRKYFSKHFLKCNQTHENIFLSGNAFTQTKRSLNSSLRLSWNVMKRYTH